MAQAALSPYPAYRETGVPWMPEAPAHWTVLRGKSLFSQSKLPVRQSDEIVTCFRDGQVTLRRNRRESGFMVALQEAGYQGVRRGQLVIHAMDAFAGAVGVSDSDGKCTPEYLVCDPQDPRSVPRYFVYALRLAARMKFIEVECNAVRERAPRLRYPNFASMRLPVPPPDEQSAIVRYLEYMDRRIRCFIRGKRKLAALLSEQRQAIVYRAVTRGLNEEVHLKSTGVDWLGEVPAHWDVQRVKRLASIKTGGRDTVERRDDGEYPFFVRSQKIEHIDSYSFDGEAVLTAGDGAGVAKVFHYATGKFDYHQRVYKFSDFRDIRGKFFYHYLAANLRFEAFRETAKSTVDSLRLPMLQSFPVTVPPIDEQDSIVYEIERRTSDIDSCQARLHEEISLVREFGSRLAGDVVSGRLDVRQAASQLPEGTDEEVALDETDAMADDDQASEEAEVGNLEGVIA